MAHIIDSKLQDLACPITLFVPIAGLVSRPWLTRFLKGDVSLDPRIVDKLVAILDEMAELKRMSLVAPDWSDTENIREQLRRRRELKALVDNDADRVRKLLEPNDAANVRKNESTLDERNS